MMQPYLRVTGIDQPVVLRLAFALHDTIVPHSLCRVRRGKRGSLFSAWGRGGWRLGVSRLRLGRAAEASKNFSCPLRDRVLEAGPRGKGNVAALHGKMTGLSRAQVTRLIGRYQEGGVVRDRNYSRNRFSNRYTTADIDLFAAVDEAHEMMSGPATQKKHARSQARSATDSVLATNRAC